MQLSNILSYREQVSRSNSWGHHFIFLNAILAVFIGSVYFYAAPPSEDFLTFVYLFVTWLGHMGFLTFLTYIVILFPLSFIGRYRIYRVLSLIVMLLFSFALLVDAKLFLAAKVHISLSVLSLMIGDLDFKTGLNFNFMFIAMPVVLLLELLFFRLSTRELYRRLERHTYFPAAVITLLCVCFISSHSIHIWADAVRYDKINILRSVFPFHYPMTARSFLSSHGWIDADDTNNSGGLSEVSLNYPLTALEVKPEAVNRNLILILVNGLSYEDLSADKTPNLMELKKSSNSYENNYLPYSNFDDNLFAIAYGLPVQYRKFVESKNIVPAVAEEMHRQEYTIRFIGDYQGNLNENDIIRLTGNRKPDKMSSSDTGVFSKAQEFLDNLYQSRNFSLTLNLKNLNDPKLKKYSRDRILKETDKEIAEFMSYLESSGRLENTLIMITSASGNPELAEQGSVYSRKQQHVPMLLIWPDGSMKGVSFTGVTSLFDLSATVGKNLLGILTPASGYSVGYDLISSPHRDFIVSTNGESLLLIASDAVTVYRRDGRAYIENGGKILPVRPNLENLIRAMRDLNRFK